MATLLEIEGLRTHFHTRAGVVRAVDGVDLDVAAGQTLGVVGESGCGKSVTALSIMGLIEPPGRIMFDGQDLVHLDEDELRDIRGNQISMVFQEPMTSLNPVLTIGDQIVEAVMLHRHVTATNAQERALEMLDLVSIPTPRRRFADYPHQLS